nr:MAG TPA: hypothetical protein [Herelleviridae sp.]
MVHCRYFCQFPLFQLSKGKRICRKEKDMCLLCLLRKDYLCG